MKIELKDYESNLNRLMEITKILEKSELSLQESLALYDEGTKLFGALKDVLDTETTKLQVLMNGEMTAVTPQELGGVDSHA